MLKAIQRLFTDAEEEASGSENRRLQVAVAVLLHEARRADYEQRHQESEAAELALVDMFAVERSAAAALLEEGRARALQLTSFYAPVSVIKREMSLDERIRLVEHLWRVTFADGRLELYEDHYVRKIAHLLYVPNTQSMLARNRARGGGGVS